MTEREKVRMNEDILKLMNSDINHSTIPTPLDTIITRLISEFYFIPDYQRKYVWNEKQVIELMISLIKNRPIPKLYMYNLPLEGKYTIIDGQQRLTSLFFFIKGIFPEKDSERKSKYNFKEIDRLIQKYNVSKDINQKNEIKNELKAEHGLIFKKFRYIMDDEKKINLEFNEFSQENKLLFLNKVFDFGVVTVINPLSENKKAEDEINKVYIDIFKLLNSAGEPLSDQEIRNGIYYNTDLYKKINEFNKNNKNWIEVKEKMLKSDIGNRSDDTEFLFRLISLDNYITFDGELELKKYTTYSKLIERLSIDFKNKEVGDLINKLEIFFNGINLESKTKVEKLNLEACFIAASKLELITKEFRLPNEIISFPLEKKSKTSSKTEIIKRVKLIMEKLLEGEL